MDLEASGAVRKLDSPQVASVRVLGLQLGASTLDLVRDPARVGQASRARVASNLPFAAQGLA
jgi:hypothetical protein